MASESVFRRDLCKSNDSGLSSGGSFGFMKYAQYIIHEEKAYFF